MKMEHENEVVDEWGNVWFKIVEMDADGNDIGVIEQTDTESKGIEVCIELALITDMTYYLES